MARPALPLFVLGAVVLLGAGAAAWFSGGSRAPRGRPAVATHLFALHDWAARVAGPDADVELLEGSGDDPHGFAPSPADTVRIQRARALLTIGLGLDPWAARALEGHEPALELWEAGTWVERRRIFGAEDPEESGEAHETHAEHAHGHSHDHGHAHDHGGEDPHVWLDPQRAARIVRELGERLAGLDPAHAEGYRRRAAEYAAELEAFAAELPRRMERLRGRPVVVFHDAYGYFFERCGLQVGGVVQLSPGLQPGPRDVTRALALLREFGQTVVFAEPERQAQAEALARELGGGVAILDPLENARVYPGEGYLARLQRNADALLEHLK
ncbi:MAG: metal ABC transporter substrate-binding protein [Planctomycetota bacterium]|nr:metal ABC transporter substrate-binding protein [Planctomycetota bacterium]